MVLLRLMGEWIDKARHSLTFIRLVGKIAFWMAVTVAFGLFFERYLDDDARFIVAIFFTMSFGIGVGPFIAAVTKHLKPPKPDHRITDEEWLAIFGPGKGDADPAVVWLGNFERILFLAAIWVGGKEGPVIIGAWLAFKLATKWEVWKNVFQVPENIIKSNDFTEQQKNDINFLIVRSYWSSWLFNRFLLGTIINILIAFFAMYISKSYWREIGDLLT